LRQKMMGATKKKPSLAELERQIADAERRLAALNDFPSSLQCPMGYHDTADYLSLPAEIRRLKQAVAREKDRRKRNSCATRAGKRRA
jgi:hypothetical protein